MATNRIIGVIAPTGSGKTTIVAERLVRAEQRIVIYDPMAQTDMPYRREATHIIVHDLRLLIETMSTEQSFKILYEPENPVQDGEDWFYPDFRKFLNVIWYYAQERGPIVLVVDEAHYLMSKRTMPLELWNIITNGRRYGLSICWITQRFVGVNAWARANAHEYWFFRLAHPADLQTVSEICGPEIAEEVRNLRRLDAISTPTVPGELLVWSSLDGQAEVTDYAKITNKVSKKVGERDQPESVPPVLPSSDNRNALRSLPDETDAGQQD